MEEFKSQKNKTTTPNKAALLGPILSYEVSLFSFELAIFFLFSALLMPACFALSRLREKNRFSGGVFNPPFDPAR
jgi:hypothetical protein